jgi:O-antigen ligase
MHIILFAAVLGTLPLFLAVLRGRQSARPYALTAIGLMLFLGDTIRINGALITWPLWTGISRGLEITPIDTLALALILTRSRVRVRLPFWAVFLFYGCALCIAAVVSYVPMASLFFVVQYARAVLLFVALAGELHDVKLRRHLVTGVALGVVLHAAFVVTQKASGVVQATGAMFHQNVLGMMTELGLLILFTSLLSGDRRKVTLLGVASAALIIGGGGSRGSMAFAAVGVCVLLVLSLARGINSHKVKVAGIFVLGAAIAAPLGLMTLKARFGSSSVTELGDQRPKFEQAARMMAADHPFGVGPNLYVSTANTQGYAGRAGVAWNYANRAAPVHNAYLLARAESGWLGQIALILLLLVPACTGVYYGLSRRIGEGGEYALGAGIGLWVNIVHNNYEFAFVSYNVMGLVMVNIALVAAQLRLDRFKKKRALFTRPVRQHHPSALNAKVARPQ